MTFLKKIAQIIITVGAIVAGVSPAIAAVPGTSAVSAALDKFEQMVTLVIHAETFGQLNGLTGPDKARTAAPLIAQELFDYARLRGWKIDDEQKPKVLAAATTIGGGVADFLNAVHPDSVKTVDIS